MTANKRASGQRWSSLSGAFGRPWPGVPEREGSAVHMRARSFFALVSLALAGCAGLGSDYNYNLEVRNIGQDRIIDCEVASRAGFYQRLGLLVSGAGDTTVGPFAQPPADYWTVRWTSSRRGDITNTIDLTQAVPRSFRGQLVLTRDNDDRLNFSTEKFYGER